MDEEKLRTEVENLKQELAEKEEKLLQMEENKFKLLPPNNDLLNKDILTNDEIARYSRQLILTNIGVNGQLKLKQTSFLIVGVGGLGCPSAQYLAAAGCGTIGLIDFDVAETNNLQRQILLTEKSVHLPKVHSVKLALLRLNSNIKVEAYHQQLTKVNAIELIEKYDIILDCTDNMNTRYLLNDICIMKEKPLVSGSAVKFDGQITVYNFQNGPCYRCIFPIPSPIETVSNCGDSGVLGPVTGVIGSLQALEAIKIALGLGEVLAGRLLIFDGLRSTFRTIKLRSKKCNFCSKHLLESDLPDYEKFCGACLCDKNDNIKILPENFRLLATDYKNFATTTKHLLVDVRAKAEFEICKLNNAINIPINIILDNSELKEIHSTVNDSNLPIIFVCRRGNDSQIAVKHMLKKMQNKCIKDIIGGLHAWHNEVDPMFPIY